MSASPDPHVRRLVSDPATKGGVELRLWTMELVHNGALLRPAGGMPSLVGELRWAAPATIAWFPAFGDRPEDAQCFSYDGFHVTPATITFFDGGLEVAELVSIEKAAVEDPDDYRVGWDLWLQVVPLRRAFIERCLAQQFAQGTRRVDLHRRTAAVPVVMPRNSARAVRSAARPEEPVRNVA